MKETLQQAAPSSTTGSPHLSLSFCPPKIQQIDDILVHYTLEQKLGSGYTGVVYDAKGVRDNRHYALKMIQKERQRLVATEKYFRDVYEFILRAPCRHAVRVVEAFETPNEFILVTERCFGPDLVEYVLAFEPGQIPEHECKRIITQILLAVNHFHMNRVLHRDVKLDNVILRNSPQAWLRACKKRGKTVTPPPPFAPKCPRALEDREECGFEDVLLLDFDMCLFLDNPEPPKQPDRPGEVTVVGTKEYMAPESFKGHYFEVSDVWSCGVILYVLVDGHFPFDVSGTKSNRDARRIVKGGVKFDSALRARCPMGVDLVASMLQYCTEDRCASAFAALNHPWLTSVPRPLEELHKMNLPLPDGIRQRLTLKTRQQKQLLAAQQQQQQEQDRLQTTQRSHRRGQQAQTETPDAAGDADMLPSSAVPAQASPSVSPSSSPISPTSPTATDWCFFSAAMHTRNHTGPSSSAAPGMTGVSAGAPSEISPPPVVNSLACQRREAEAVNVRCSQFSGSASAKSRTVAISSLCDSSRSPVASPTHAGSPLLLFARGNLAASPPPISNTVVEARLVHANAAGGGAGAAASSGGAGRGSNHRSRSGNARRTRNSNLFLAPAAASGGVQAEYLSPHASPCNSLTPAQGSLSPPPTGRMTNRAGGGVGMGIGGGCMDLDAGEDFPPAEEGRNSDDLPSSSGTSARPAFYSLLMSAGGAELSQSPQQQQEMAWFSAMHHQQQQRHGGDAGTGRGAGSRVGEDSAGMGGLFRAPTCPLPNSLASPMMQMYDGLGHPAANGMLPLGSGMGCVDDEEEEDVGAMACGAYEELDHGEDGQGSRVDEDLTSSASGGRFGVEDSEQMGGGGENHQRRRTHRKPPTDHPTAMNVDDTCLHWPPNAELGTGFGAGASADPEQTSMERENGYISTLATKEGKRESFGSHPSSSVNPFQEGFGDAFSSLLPHTAGATGTSRTNVEHAGADQGALQSWLLSQHQQIHHESPHTAHSRLNPPRGIPVSPSSASHLSGDAFQPQQQQQQFVSLLHPSAGFPLQQRDHSISPFPFPFLHPQPQALTVPCLRPNQSLHPGGSSDNANGGASSSSSSSQLDPGASRSTKEQTHRQTQQPPEQRSPSNPESDPSSFLPAGFPAGPSALFPFSHPLPPQGGSPGPGPMGGGCAWPVGASAALFPPPSVEGLAAHSAAAPPGGLGLPFVPLCPPPPGSFFVLSPLQPLQQQQAQAHQQQQQQQGAKTNASLGPGRTSWQQQQPSAEGDQQHQLGASQQ